MEQGEVEGDGLTEGEVLTLTEGLGFAEVTGFETVVLGFSEGSELIGDSEGEGVRVTQGGWGLSPTQKKILGVEVCA